MKFLEFCDFVTEKRMREVYTDSNENHNKGVKRMKTVIIGGVAGGATAAARLRRRRPDMEIVILERGQYISYANCGLPYYIGGVIQNRDALLLQTPEAMKQKFNIDVRIQSEAVAVLPEEKKVKVQNVVSGEIYEESYDKLILASGSSPVKPPIPGIDGAGIFTLWNVPDTDRIKSYIEEQKPKHAAVIGGGFIGLEMAENLKEAGISVSLIEMQDQVMAPVDFEMAQLLHENLEMNGVTLYLSDGVKEFCSRGKETEILLSSGTKIQADIVILSIGVRPNSSLAKEAGLALNQRGGVLVDEELRTSHPDIYAVGDVIETQQLATGEKTMIPLAGPANKQGRICADNIAGDHKTYKGSLGTSVAKVFDLDVAAVGVNEKTLKASGRQKGKEYETLMIVQKDHAGYYPGAVPMMLKLIFDRQGRIYGAQIVGQEGVDKRIDSIAAVMMLKGTVHDLAGLELAYAPPFSSAKDPVNMAGFVAENILDGMVSFAEWKEVDELIASGRKDYTVLDVTEQVERMVFSVPGSYHIPLGQLTKRLKELDKAKQIITYCAIGVRAYNAARILMGAGFTNVKVLSGGASFYKSMHYRDYMSQPQKELEAAELKPEGEAEMEKELKIIDCCGLQCPGPIMKVHEAVETMETGEKLKVSATDMGFARDIDAWCRRTGNTLIKTERNNKENIVYIQKGVKEAQLKESAGIREMDLPQGKTIIVFSGDLDKVLASFIIANGAAAMGRPVTMFFTFWGLNALRKTQKKKVKKSMVEKMFAAMMPRGSKKLKLSKMNMAGMGTAMMKKVMKDKNVDSLEELMKHAMANGIKLVACTMSMDIMGITKEELLEGVEYAGVASYLSDAEESNVNLFI